MLAISLAIQLATRIQANPIAELCSDQQSYPFRADVRLHSIDKYAL